MEWFTGGKHGEAKRLIQQLEDANTAKGDQAARDLIGLDSDAVSPLLEALQTKDQYLLLIYEQILARIPSASPALIKILATAHPILRARASDIFSINKETSAMLAPLDALQGEFYTIRARATLALGRIGDRVRSSH
jgi:HEAT repeat protein